MSADQEIRGINEARLAAVKAGDMKKLDELLAADLIAVSPTGAVLGKAQMMADLQSGDFRIQDYAADEYRVGLHGDVAVVAFRNRMSHSYKGTTHSGLYRVTSVYAKRQSRWMLVAQQVTSISPQPNPG